MSVQPPPTKDADIFNPAYFVSMTEGVTAEYVDLLYLKKAGGQTVVAAETFTGGILTNSITPSTGTNIDMAGDINATGAYKIGSTNVLTSTSLGSAVTSSSLTSVGTLTSLNVSGSVAITGNSSQTGNLTISGNITQNSGYVTQLRTTTISGTATVSRLIASSSTAGNNTFAADVICSANVSVAGSLAGTLSTAAQPNVTSVGTLTSLSVTGAIAGTLSTAAQPNITSVGTLTSLTVSGTATLANISTSNLNGYNPSTELAKLTNQTIANVNETTITGALLISDSALSVSEFPGGSNTYGAFTTSSSSYFSFYEAFQAVRPATLIVYWQSAQNNYPSSGGVYTGTTTTAGYAGEWWQLAATYLFSLTTVQMTNSASPLSTNCKTFYVLGSTDLSSWTLLGSGSSTTAVNITNPTYRMYYVRIVITETSVQGSSTSCFIPHINFSGRVAEGTCNIKGNATFQANVNVSGATTLANVTCTSLTCSGNITQSGTTTANLRTLNVSTASNLTGNVGITGNLSVSGNITASSKLFVDSNEIHSIAGTRDTTSLTGSQSSFNFTWTTGRRAMLITLVNFTSTASPNILIYGSSGTANITLSGYTCGNNAGAQTAWGSSIPLYNTTWTSGGNINVALEIYQLNSTTYMVKGHSHRIDVNYYCHYYGTIVFSNGATLSYPYITGGSMNATSVNYVQF